MEILRIRSVTVQLLCMSGRFGIADQHATEWHTRPPSCQAILALRASEHSDRPPGSAAPGPWRYCGKRDRVNSAPPHMPFMARLRLLSADAAAALRLLSLRHPERRGTQRSVRSSRVERHGVVRSIARARHGCVPQSHLRQRQGPLATTADDGEPLRRIAGTSLPTRPEPCNDPRAESRRFAPGGILEAAKVLARP